MVSAMIACLVTIQLWLSVSAQNSVVSPQQSVVSAQQVMVSADHSVVSAENNGMVTVSGCGKVILECEEGKMMVVREASFTPVMNEEECGRGGEVMTSHNNQDILLAVVRRCNGEREGKCVFDMTVDLPESGSWLVMFFLAFFSYNAKKMVESRFGFI